MRSRFMLAATTVLAATVLAATIAGPALAQTAGAINFITHVEITGLSTPVPCAGESIRIVISGIFPDNCHRIRKIDEIPILCIRPCRPPMRILIDDGGCEVLPCVTVLVPFRQELHVPPLPEGDYEQAMYVYVASCTDVFPSLPPVQTVVSPFRVASGDLCGSAPPRCLLPFFGNRLPDPELCDIKLGADGTGHMPFAVSTPVALRALQGRFRISDDALRVVNLKPIGPADGMTLIWNPVADGATFVMFSATGAPIPATSGTLPPNILDLTVGTVAGRRPLRNSYLMPGEFLGATESGVEVNECAVNTRERMRAAIICSEVPCDANGDGRSSVGDLVEMLICLRSACADSSDFDCDGDGHFALADVFCCARRILRVPLSPITPVRPSPGTRVVPGELRRTPDGWKLPITLEGSLNVAAARLDLSYPADRYEIVGVTQLPGAASWLTFDERSESRVSLGLLNLSDDRALMHSLPDHVEVELELRLKPGAEPGGAIAVASGEFSGRDGAALEVALPSRTIDLPNGVTLAPGRPNPFSTSVSLALGLETARSVRVTVHDLSGRMVATLVSGPVEAGTREVRWNGRTDRGDPARDGIYFVRCQSGDRIVSQKIALMRAK